MVDIFDEFMLRHIKKEDDEGNMAIWFNYDDLKAPIEKLQGMITTKDKDLEAVRKHNRALDALVKELEADLKKEKEINEQLYTQKEALRCISKDMEADFTREREEKEKWETGYHDRVTERDRAEEEVQKMGAFINCWRGKKGKPSKICKTCPNDFPNGPCPFHPESGKEDD